MTKNYEVTVAVSLSLPPDDRSKVIDSIPDLITTLKGKIIKSDSWGEKPLAYRIKRDDSALFQHYQVELPSLKVKDLTKKIQLIPGVIRSLIVISE